MTAHTLPGLTGSIDPRLTEIRLYGPLGAKFGRVHRYAVRNIGEAISALSAMVKGFENELATSFDRGIKYAVFHGKKNVDQDHLLRDHGNNEIRIAPILNGSKKGGLFQLVVGVALIAASFYAPVALTGTLGGAITYGGATAIGGIALSLGMSMALGSIQQMFSPTQKGLSTKDGPDNTPSFNMNGAVNTTAQGNPHPLAYGEVWAGSAVVSAGIFSEDTI